MESDPARQCHHIKTSGVRCGSPALRDRRYCYYHQRSRPILLDLSGREDKPALFSLPTFEDGHSIQFALRNVAHRLLDGNIDAKTAGLLFYCLQIASSNLKNIKAETPQPEQVVVDPPQLSEIPRPEPTSEPVRLNSHTTRLTNFPETPSIKDEYADDVRRQARELREDLAFQIDEEERRTGRKKPKKPEVSDIWDKDKKDKKRDGLPPGTIQACVRSRRSERRSEKGYVN